MFSGIFLPSARLSRGVVADPLPIDRRRDAITELVKHDMGVHSWRQSFASSRAALGSRARCPVRSCRALANCPKRNKLGVQIGVRAELGRT
jgi:hypothetical protein